MESTIGAPSAHASQRVEPTSPEWAISPPKLQGSGWLGVMGDCGEGSQVGPTLGSGHRLGPTCREAQGCRERVLST